MGANVKQHSSDLVCKFIHFYVWSSLLRLVSMHSKSGTEVLLLVSRSHFIKTSDSSEIDACVLVYKFKWWPESIGRAWNWNKSNTE